MLKFRDEISRQVEEINNTISNEEESPDAKRFFDEGLCQENPCAPRAVLDVNFFTEDLVTKLLMVSAEEAHQIRNQGEEQEHGKADEHNADNTLHAAVRCFFLVGFLRFAAFVFGHFLALFRLFLF